MNTSTLSHTGRESESVLRWGAILAGSVVALGILATLYALGLGTGFAAVDTDVEGRFRSVGIFAGAFGALVPLVALFVGGLVASRAARAANMGAGMLHGLVLWGITALSLVWLAASLVGGVVSGTASVVGEVAKVGGSAVAKGMEGLGQVGESAAQALPQLADQAKAKLGDKVNLDFDDALKAINAKRKLDGKGAITPDQLRRAGEKIVRDAVAKGDLDRDRAVGIVVDETSVTREEATTVVTEIDKRVSEARKEIDEQTAKAKQKFEELRQDAQEKVAAATNVAAEKMGQVFFGLFAALAIGLLAALGGAATDVATRRP